GGHVAAVHLDRIRSHAGARCGRAEATPPTVEHDCGCLALGLLELVEHRPEGGGVSSTLLLTQPGLDLHRCAAHQEVGGAPPSRPLRKREHEVTLRDQLRSHGELGMGQAAGGLVEYPTRGFVVMATRQRPRCDGAPPRQGHWALAPFDVPAPTGRSGYWRSCTSKTGQAGPRWIRWATRRSRAASGVSCGRTSLPTRADSANR